MVILNKNLKNKNKSYNCIRSFTVKPIITYDNPLLMKSNIIKENKNKSGVYR